MQCRKGAFADALKSYQEALEIYRKLVQSNPHDHLSDIAAMLNNLGNLQYQKNELDDALKSYQEALEVRRKLVRLHPQGDSSDLAGTLNNLAALQFDKGEFDDALNHTGRRWRFTGI